MGKIYLHLLKVTAFQSSKIKSNSFEVNETFLLSLVTLHETAVKDRCM